MKKNILILVCIFLGINAFSQNPSYFKNEVDKLKSSTPVDIIKQDLIIFTGSSSIRNWKNINEAFPDYTIINNGFGGSHMSDLLFYADDLIVNFRPVQVFIYEGDNDLDYGKSVDSIVKDANRLVSFILDTLPDCYIVFISAKPSPSRWDLKNSYIELNAAYKNISDQQNQVEFVNIWDIMLNKNGVPIPEIFESDSLHINEKGYELLRKKIKKYLYK